MSTVLVLGASGATGQLAVQILLQKGANVIAIVRNKNSLVNIDCSQPSLKIIEAEISEISESDLAQHLTECDIAISCLGHNLTFKGMFGHPRRLVTDAIKKVAKTLAAVSPHKTFKIILMNTSGNSNDDIPEKPPLSQRLVIFLLRYLLPPHVDNENAADFLRTQIGQNHNIEWVVVRPDGLINQEQVSKYDLYDSPIRNVIFDAGNTSRINVADFMSNLALEPELWTQWKGKMPVIYDHI